MIQTSEELAELQEAAAEAMWQYLRHGDDRHQAWLKLAIYAFFRGEERPKESGIEECVSDRESAEPENTGTSEEFTEEAA